jgi:hypothetical protein
MAEVAILLNLFRVIIVAHSSRIPRRPADSASDLNDDQTNNCNGASRFDRLSAQTVSSMEASSPQSVDPSADLMAGATDCFGEMPANATSPPGKDTPLLRVSLTSAECRR